MEIRMTLTGTASLLMHNAQLSDPLNSYTKSLKEVSSKRTKTEDDHWEMARIEFLGGLYHDDELGPYIPGANLHRCLNEGAKLNKLGRHVERGVVVLSERLPLAYIGPRDMDGLWADENFRSRLSVGVTTSRVMRTRPMFRNWMLEADLMVDTQQLDFDQICGIAEKAGAMIGLGDYRPHHGRFTVEVTQIA
jgi:hypothetical protein